MYADNDEYSEMKEGSEENLPVVTGDQYNAYIKSLIKLLVGEDVMQDWLKKGGFS